MGSIEAAAFLRPGSVGVIEERLAVIAYRLAVSIDHDEGIIALFGRAPSVVRLLWVSDGDGAVVLERRCPRPKGANPRARGLEVWYNFLERFEVVACLVRQGLAHNILHVRPDTMVLVSAVGYIGITYH